MVVAVTCAIATGVVFGFIPARRAARLDPIAAFRSDQRLREGYTRDVGRP
jgi:macrolide transport system ATP-binding/permease protein